MIEWAILYSDGTTFTSEDGEHHEAPRNNVAMVFYASEATGVSIESSLEGLWIWREGMWMGTDTFGFYDYLFHEPGPDLCVLFGRTLPDKQWEGVVHQKINEIMKQPKTAWRKRERRY